MIKRYAHITIGMLASEEGDWVKYEDVENLIKEKTIEQHRAEFEALVCNDVNLHKQNNGDYVSDRAQLAWSVWKAAKSIIE